MDNQARNSASITDLKENELDKKGGKGAIFKDEEIDGDDESGTKLIKGHFPDIHGSAESEIETLNNLRREIRKLHSDLKYTIISCKNLNQSTQEQVFIAYSQQEGRTREETMLGHTVLFKNPLIIDNEGLKVRASESAQNLRLSPEEVSVANDIIQKHSDDLWKSHSNLNAISISGLKSRNKGKTVEKKICVVLLCSSKGYVPVGEKEFPKNLELRGSRVDVDVREGYFDFGPGGNYPTDYSWSIHVPLTMGCCISRKQGSNCGTVGPFVDLGNGKTGFLTCSHVLFDIKKKILDFNCSPEDEENNVVQPPHFSTGDTRADPCGMIKKALFKPDRTVSVDAAVVEIVDDERVPVDGHFALKNKLDHIDLGFEEMPKFDNGTIMTICEETKHMVNRTIFKFGAETHQTKGCLKPCGIQVRTMFALLGLPNFGDEIRMKGQLGVEGTGIRRFFDKGDSGAGVFLKEDDCTLHCIGMAIGCTSEGTTIVTPIQDVLDALEIKNGLKTFHENMETN